MNAMTGFDTNKDAALRLAEEAAAELTRVRAEHAEAMKVTRRVAEMYETEQELGSFPEGKTWLYIPHALGQSARSLLTKVGAP